MGAPSTIGRSTLFLTDADGHRRAVRLDSKRIAQGADGAVYRILDSPGLAAKIYHDPSQDPRRREKLDAMLAAPPNLPPIPFGGRSYVQIAWPVGCLESSAGAFVGYAMPLADLEQSVMLELLLSKQARLAYGLPEDPGVRLSAAYNLCAVISELHRMGHYVIDLKPANINVFTDRSFITLLDCDGLSIRGETKRFPAHQFTDGCIAPEALNRKLKPRDLGETQDRFALAVIVFQLMNEGIHPFSGVPADNELPTTVSGRIAAGLYAYGRRPDPRIAPSPWSIHSFFDADTAWLFERAFSGTPETRPSAEELKAHLRPFAEKSPSRVHPCPADPTHVAFSGGCPYCDQEKKKRAALLAKPKVAAPRKGGARLGRRRGAQRMGTRLPQPAPVPTSTAPPSLFKLLPLAPKIVIAVVSAVVLLQIVRMGIGSFGDWKDRRFMDAVVAENRAVVEEMVEDGFSFYDFSLRETAAEHALSLEDDTLLRTLLESKIIEARDCRRALAEVVRENRTATLKLLLESGLHPDTKIGFTVERALGAGERKRAAVILGKLRQGATPDLDRGNPRVFQRLVEKGTLSYQVDLPLLSAAAAVGNRPMVQLLLARGADVRSPAQGAYLTNFYEGVYRTAELDPRDVKAYQSPEAFEKAMVERWTLPLDFAGDRLDIARDILAFRYTKKSLFRALIQDDLSTARNVILNRNIVEDGFIAGEDDYLPLLIRYGTAEAVDLYFDAQIDSRKLASAVAPDMLVLGVNRNDPEILKVLIAHLPERVSLSSRQENWAMPRELVIHKAEGPFAALLGKNAEVDEGAPLGERLLAYARREERLDVISIIEGALSRWSPLFFACAEGALESGFDPAQHPEAKRARDRKGRNLLMTAIAFGRKKTAAALIDAGVGIEDKDAAGDTPLVYAVRAFDAELVERLLDRNAPLFTGPNSGFSALSVAEAELKKLRVAGMATDVLLGRIGRGPDPPQKKALSKIWNLLYAAKPMRGVAKNPGTASMGDFRE